MYPWLIAIVVILLIGIIVSTRTRTAQRWYDRTESARKAISVVIGILVAVVFLASGDPIRSIIGIFIIAIGALYLFIERPWDRV